MPPRRTPPRSSIARHATQQEMTRRLLNLQRQAQAIISATPRRMMLATQRNRNINANRAERARTIQGREAARRAASRAAILRERRTRVSQSNINSFKRMMSNTSGHAFNFNNASTLNLAWNRFTRHARNPYYPNAPYYTVPNWGENTYRRIRQHYARAAQQAALNAQQAALNAHRGQLNAQLRQIQTRLNQARTAHRRRV